MMNKTPGAVKMALAAGIRRWSPPSILLSPEEAKQ